MTLVYTYTYLHNIWSIVAICLHNGWFTEEPLLGVVEIDFSVMGLPAIMNLRSQFQETPYFWQLPCLRNSPKSWPSILGSKAKVAAYIHIVTSTISCFYLAVFFGAIGENLNTNCSTWASNKNKLPQIQSKLQHSSCRNVPKQCFAHGGKWRGTGEPSKSERLQLVGLAGPVVGLAGPVHLGSSTISWVSSQRGIWRWKWD